MIPELNFKNINSMVAELAVLDYYPTDTPARAAIVRTIGSMANSEDEVRWLVDRATSGLYVKWPGIHEIRALFCSHFTPRDGFVIYSQQYPDGYPHQLKDRLLEAPRWPKRTPEEDREYAQWAEETKAQIEALSKAHSIPPPPRELTTEEKDNLYAELDRLMKERREKPENA